MINKEELEVIKNTRYQNKIPYYEVTLIHTPTSIESFASSLNNEYDAYSIALIMLKDKIEKNN